MKPKKPPIGVMPEKLWRERRVVELLDAASRYVRAYGFCEKALEWIREVEEHLIVLESKKIKTVTAEQLMERGPEP